MINDRLSAVRSLEEATYRHGMVCYHLTCLRKQLDELLDGKILAQIKPKDGKDWIGLNSSERVKEENGIVYPPYGDAGKRRTMNERILVQSLLKDPKVPTMLTQLRNMMSSLPSASNVMENAPESWLNSAKRLVEEANRLYDDMERDVLRVRDFLGRITPFRKVD